MIVVTTPTGHIGSVVLEKLARSQEKIRVIARDPSKLSSALRERAEVMQGSLDDASFVEKAYQGADDLFFVVPPSNQYANADEYYKLFGRITCEAIKKQKVKRVVFVSGTGLGHDKKAGAVMSSFYVEEMLLATGAAVRILHCGTFMENLMYALQPIRFKGQFGTSVPADVKLPWVATKDIAAVAVDLLLNKTWAGQESVGILGPEDLSYGQVAEVMSKVLGREIQYQPVASETLKSTLKQFGSSEAAAQGLVDIYGSMARGTFNQIQRTDGNSSPTSLSEWCEQVFKPALNS